MPRTSWLAIACLGLGACGDDPLPPASSGSSDGTTTVGPGSATTTGSGPATPGSTGPASTGVVDGSSGEPGGSSSSTGEPPVEGPWEPGTVYPTDEEPNARGFLDRRGAIHSHSPYSHDACDGEPLDGRGNPDAQCMVDLREGLCRVQHDFVMFTDHNESFSDNEFPDVLLFDPARGDVLLERDGDPVGNWSACEGDVRPTLLLAGCESGTMPVGIEHHAPGGSVTYGQFTPEATEELKAAGAVVLVAHTEEFDVAQLTDPDLALDGFEMYNLHANLEANIGAGLELLGLILSGGRGLPHSDLVLFPLWQEDPRYLERWGSVLDSGVRRVTTMGTDAHRNTFPQALPDGERIDSFRRMLTWFSNHLLVEPAPDGSWGDLELKDALLAGRLYGVFEYMGYAEGFDAYVDASGETYEIGSDVSLADEPQIVVQRPRVQNLDPAVTPPIITMHVMQAIDGGFLEVATETGDQLSYAPTEPGAYRVEVRISPLHLTDDLGNYADEAGLPRVWIYANPFYVGS